MVASEHDGTTGGFQPLLSFGMGVRFFTSDWAHCDRMSTYMARSISHNRGDSLLHANLFSSALNELMETLFRVNAGQGDIQVTVLRSGRIDRVELVFACDEASWRFYEGVLSRIDDPDAQERYTEALFTQGSLGEEVGLMELAIDYQARLSVRREADATVRLIADFDLEPS